VEAPTMLTAKTSEIRRDMNDSMLLIDFALAKIDTFSEATWLAAARPWPDARRRCIVLPAQREMPVGYRFYTLRLWSRP
jgi:hypothetical protein